MREREEDEKLDKIGVKREKKGEKGSAKLRGEGRRVRKYWRRRGGR